MPYTPPSQQHSPASSVSVTPGYSRAQSRLTANAQNNVFTSPPVSPGPRPNPPRSHSSSASTDYLSKTRRSPAFEDQKPTVAQVEYARAMAETHERKSLSLNTSIRQSPPPVSDNAMPVGMLVSPPDSTQNSSDDEAPQPRFIEHNSDELAELEKAVRSMRSADDLSGSRKNDTVEKDNNTVSLAVPQSASPRQSSTGRRIAHSRSSSESAIIHSQNQSPSDGSEEDDELKPPLIRKKSGELVKPAIRPPSRRRHSSMPGTPTYSKAVHFNDNIEQVRHFLQVDRPIAVSAGGSPVETLEDQNEFPFGSQNQDWEIRLVNFPRDTYERASQPIRVEKLFLSADQKCLIGTAAVANLAFHKTVHARFTFDFWKTTSEVAAEYNNDPRQQARNDGYDQFNFTVKLTDQRNLEMKTLLICMRYAVNGQEFWDNNNNMNYQIDFKKQTAPEQRNSSTQQTSQRKDSVGLGSNPALPRSRHNSTAGRRPRSVPSFDDDFSSGFDGNSYFDLRKNSLGKKKSFDNPPRKVNPGSQQFGNRYDFSASLTAALNQAQVSMGDRNNRQTGDSHPPITTGNMARIGIQAPTNSGADSPRPDALLANSQSLDSKAYQDFVSKFCFFGSGKPATDKPHGTSSPLNTSDGANEDGPLARANKQADKGAVHNEYTQSLAPRELSTGSQSYLSQNGSGNNSPHGQSSPMSVGYPFSQRSGFFTPESQTPSVQG